MVEAVVVIFTPFVAHLLEVSFVTTARVESNQVFANEK